MAQQTLNLGTTANDGTGDTLRAAGLKINSNFTEVYSNVSSAQTTAQAAYNAANSYSSVDVTFTQASFNTANLAIIIGQNAYNKANNSDFNIAANVAMLRGELTANATAGILYVNSSVSSNLANVKFSDTTIYGNGNVTIITSELVHQYTSIDLFKDGDLNIYANSNVTIYTDSSSSVYNWKFGKDGILTFPNGSQQSGGMMNLVAFKALVAASSDFNDFQTRVAAL